MSISRRARNWKAQRRLTITAAHAVARERFVRWGFQHNRLPPAGVPFWRCREWHQWHALGCP